MLDKVIGWIIPFCCGSVISAITSYVAFGHAMCEGLKCLLRAEIIRSHDKYIGRGYCPIYAKEALKRAYKAYHALRGNDVATRLYEETMKLPTDPPKEKEE